MSKKESDWWDKSWSVVTGCNWPEGEVPEGCRNCWAEKLAKRFPVVHFGDAHDPADGCPSTGEQDWSTVVMRPDRLNIPLKRRTPTVFACSLLGDLFHHDVPREFIDKVWETIEIANVHQFVVLTKRWQYAADLVNWLYRGADPEPGEHEHFILMASVWDQASTDAACQAFAQLPTGVKWGLHMEPLLGPVDLRPWLGICTDPQCRDSTWDHYCGEGSPQLSWVVVGSENGRGARPFCLHWAREIQAHCRMARVPYWFKGAYKQDVPQEMVVREVPWEAKS